MMERWIKIRAEQTHFFNRYELLEPQEQESNVRIDGTPPPLPARQNYQVVGPNKNLASNQKKEKEHGIYGTTKQFSEGSGVKHHNHEHHSKESNYVTQRVMENNRHDNYQRIDNMQRNQEPTSNYVKLQKEKYEVKQENVYASQRDLHKSENHGHQKLTVSNSLPIAQNATYSLPKTGSNNNLVRFSDYEANPSHDKANVKGNERNSKFEIYDVKITERNGKYDPHDKTNDRRIYNYEFDESQSEVRRSRYESDEAQHGDKKMETIDINRDIIRYEIPHEFKVGEKVTCLKTSISERPVPHKVSIEYRQKDITSSLPPEMRITDGNSTDISTLPSEDELSNGSGNVSPRLRRANRHRGGNLTPSSGSSRNQSPRPKPGARNSHRNSANLSSSTLQEDLMKLINPDYIADDMHISNNHIPNNNLPTILSNNQNSNKVNNNMIEIQNRCRSRENLCGNSTTTLSVLPTNGQENGNVSEVILTMARPATVISNASTASSPAPSENKLSKEER